MRALTMGAPLAVAAALVLGGCTPAPAAHHTAVRGAALPGDFSGSGPGTLVAAEDCPTSIPGYAPIRHWRPASPTCRVPV